MIRFLPKFPLDLLARGVYMLAFLSVLAPPISAQQQAQLTPELVVQTGHSEAINGLAFSSDGKLLASGGRDALRLWDVTTGKEMRTFRIAWGVEAVGFTSDNSKVVAMGKQVSTFDVSTGAETVVCQDLGSPQFSFCAARNLVAYHDSHIIHFLDVGTGKEIGNFKSPTQVVGALAISPSGQTIAIGSGKEQIYIAPGGGGTYHGNTNKTVTIHQVPGGKVVANCVARATYFSALAFSPDGTQLAASAFDPTPPNTPYNAIKSAQVVTWDANSGQVVRDFPVQQGATFFTSVAFSPDARTLAASQPPGSFNYITLWNIESGERQLSLEKEVPASSARRHQGGADVLVFHPNKAALVSADYGLMTLWDARSGREIYRLRPRSTDIQFISFVPTLNTLALVTPWGEQSWNLATGQQQCTISQRFYGTIIGARGRLIANEVTDNTTATMKVAVFNTSTGELVCETPPMPIGTDIRGITLSPDERLLAFTTSKDLFGPRDVEIWDIGKQKRQALISGVSDVASGPTSQTNYGDAMAFNPESTQITLWTSKKDLTSGARTWNINKGQPITGAKAPRYPGGIQNGKGQQLRVPLLTTIDPMTLVDPATKQTVLTFDKEKEAVGLSVTYTFSPAGKYLVRLGDRLSDNRPQIDVWDAVSGRLLRSMDGHEEDITSFSFSPDDRLLFTGSKDDTIKIWDLAQGTQLATFVPIDTTEWILVTPDNYFMASRRALTGVAFRIGNQAFPFEQFDLRYNRPDIVLGRLGFASQATLDILHQAYERRLRRLGFTEALLASDFNLPELSLLTNDVPLSTSEKTLKLDVKASDSLYELNRLRVSVNDVPLYGEGGLDLRPKNTKECDQSLTLPLTPGRNKIQISVLNEKGVASLSENVEIACTAAFPKPDLYVVVIGVSEYNDKNNLLKYPSKDADDLATLFETQSTRYNAIHVKRLINADATRANIEKVKSDLLSQSQPDDEVVLFVAGHGMLDADLNYYFGTVDIDFDKPALKGLPYDALEAVLDGIPARHKLLLMDTCHAGEVDKPDTSPVDEKLAPAQNAPAENAPEDQETPDGLVKTRAVRLKSKKPGAGKPLSSTVLPEIFADLRQASGATIIAAAGGDQYALEAPQWNNGVFTFAVLDGLKNKKADANADGQITTAELQAYVIGKVQSLTRGRQTPTARRENLEFDFPVLEPASAN